MGFAASAEASPDPGNRVDHLPRTLSVVAGAVVTPALLAAGPGRLWLLAERDRRRSRGEIQVRRDRCRLNLDYVCSIFLCSNALKGLGLRQGLGLRIGVSFQVLWAPFFFAEVEASFPTAFLEGEGGWVEIEWLEESDFKSHFFLAWVQRGY